jgi:uncharacterized protein (TIGR02271 family)
MNHRSMEDVQQLQGRPVYAQEGETIGRVEEIYYDYETNQPEWIGVGTGLFGKKRVLVPVAGSTVEADGLRVPHSKDTVQDSPDIDSDEISQELEYELASYYGIGYSERRSDTGLPEGAPDSPGDSTEGSAAVTRSEEELHVGKEAVQSGHARLRKWVETEPVSMDVQLKQETARVTREPVEQPVSDVEIGDEEVEVELRGERPVVEKRAVARERISLEKDVQTETAAVSDEVRKERVDVEGDAA